MDGMLAAGWSREEAVDLMWTVLSIRNWEQLTIECGWSQDRYVGGMQELLKRALSPTGAFVHPPGLRIHRRFIADSSPCVTVAKA